MEKEQHRNRKRTKKKMEIKDFCVLKKAMNRKKKG